MAHRGASGYAPENTLDAFQKAIDMTDGIINVVDYAGEAGSGGIFGRRHHYLCVGK